MKTYGGVEDRRLDGSQNQSEHDVKEKNPQPLPGIKP
jgi:hypothetical protein